MELFEQLAVATGTATTTILIHLTGLATLIALLQAHGSRVRDLHRVRHQVTLVIGAAFGLFALHALEIWLYAAVYLVVGELKTFEDALYFSTSTYATIGYGDIVLTRHWRLLSAIEGVNGIILLGWSTAFFFSVVQRLRALEMALLPGESAGR